MSLDLSSYKPASGESPISSAKMRNSYDAIQNFVNDLPVANVHGYPADATKFLDGSGSWSVPATDLAARYVKTTTTDVQNSVAATDLFGGAFTIAANKMGANGAIKIYAGGDYLNNSGVARTIILGLSLGASALWTTAISDEFASNAARRAWHLSAVIQALAATNAQQGSGTFLIGHTAAPTTGTGTLIKSDTNPLMPTSFLTAATAVNMTAGQTLTFTVTHSAAAATISMRCLYARVEVGT